MSPADTHPASDAFEVVPSADPLPRIPRALYVAAAGDVVAEIGSGPVTFTARAGQFIPIRPTRILPATTATGIVALL